MADLSIGAVRDGSPPPPRFTLDRRVSIGTLIQVGMLGLTILAGYFRIEARIEQNSYRIGLIEAHQEKSDDRIAAALDRIYDKLDAKADKQSAAR